MKNKSWENMRKKERKLCLIASRMIRKNKLEKIIKKERWIDVHKLKMKVAVFLIVTKYV